MNPVLLIVTICLYVTSVVFALLSGMAAKRIRPGKILIPMAIHLVLIFTGGVFLLILQGQLLSNYLLLAGVCSGVAIAGWALRNNSIPWFLRIYLGSYLLSLPVFLWSPSLLFYTISGNYPAYRPEQQLDLGKNYHIIEQQSMLKTGQDSIRYKVVRKFGIYNQTLARNLDFGEPISKATTVKIADDTMIIAVETASAVKDTIGFRPGMKKNTITRKKTGLQ